jgi:hypothetical protein
MAFDARVLSLARVAVIVKVSVIVDVNVGWGCPLVLRLLGVGEV